MRLLPARRRIDSLAPLAGGTRARIARRDGVGAGWVNGLSGQGSLRDTQMWTRHDPGLRLSSHDVRGLLRADAMAHRICYREPQDATRERPTITGSVRGVPLEADAEQQKAWASWLDDLGVWGALVQGRAGARAFGGAAWVLWVEDGRRSDQPIDWTNIRRVAWVKVLRGGSHSLIQPLEVERDPCSPRHGQPRLYNVSFPEGGAGVFHWQRVVIFQGEVTDAESLVENNGWGESVLDRVWAALRNFGAGHAYAALALQKLSQGVFQSEYLANALEAGFADDAARRLEDVSLGMGATGEIALGTNESYSIVGRPISGMDGVLKVFADALVAATDMPEMVLMGKRPGGLSTASDGEFRGWYDFVSSQQPTHYTPPLLRLIQIGSRASMGPTGGVPVLEAGLDWPPLWQLTEAEKDASRLAKAQARSADLASRSVTEAEARTDPDLAEHYTLGAAQVPDEAAMAEAGEDIEIQDTNALDDGDTLLSLSEAGAMIGYRSPAAIRAFASQHGALFRPGARYRVSKSRLQAGLSSSMVPAPDA